MNAASPSEVTAAKAYEELFVPALFDQWTPMVLDAAGVGSGHRVLDVACGTGILARRARERVGDATKVAGVDPAPGMLAVAEQTAPDIDWRRGTAEALPFADGTFDAVVSQFGLMFFDDQRRAMAEMSRVLKDGGRLAVAVWESLERIPAIAQEVALLERVAGQQAADALRAPFVLGDQDGLTALAQGASVESVEVRSQSGKARFPSIRSLVEADLRGWLPLMGVVLAEDVIERILDEADQQLSEYAEGDGEMIFDMPALILTGKKG